jgi:hypothetical protein
MDSETTRILNLEDPADWLRAKGAERRIALGRASERLLEVYRLSPRIPGKAINLRKLAALRRAEIVLIKNLRGMGRILPVAQGFQVLVSTGLSYTQYRAVISHELAHTLFFLQDGEGVPARLFPPGPDEQKFCIDLSRHILAPEWLLEESRVFDESDTRRIFSILAERLCMPRTFASRLMLADYELRVGLADRWVMDSSGWKLANGYSSVSPAISGPLKNEKIIRERLRRSALHVIQGRAPDPDLEAICLWEKDNKAAFVIIVKRHHS